LLKQEPSAVPIAKYFVVVGSALVALLLISGWSLPAPRASLGDRPEIIERTVIRIRSEHKWPEKIVLDTSKPTLAPPIVTDHSAAPSPVPLPPGEAAGQSNLEAMAQLRPDAQPASIDHPAMRVKRGVARTARSRRVATGSVTHPLAGADTGWDCCQFDRDQARSHAMPSRHAASSWLFE
jgi:hypothetical protein